MDAFTSGQLFTAIQFIAIFAVSIAIIEVILRLAARALRSYSGRAEALLDAGVIGVIRPLLYIAVVVGVVIPFTVQLFPEAGLGVYALVAEVLIGGLIAYKIIGKVLRLMGERVSRTMGKEAYGGIYIPLAKLVRAVVVVVVFLALIYVLGIDLTPFIFGWGFGLFIFALAIQGFLGDIVAGWYILLSRPFKIKDVIKLPTGEVCEILDIKGQRSVLEDIVTRDVYDVSNLDLLKSRITRLDGVGGDLTLTLKAKISKAADVETARSLIYQVAKEVPYVSAEEETNVYLLELAEGSGRFEIALPLTDLSKKREATDIFNTNIIKAFEAHNLLIQ